MSWVIAADRQPRAGQWVVIVFGDQFKVGRFDKKHPLGPLVQDPYSGRYWIGFSHWKPLSMPKVNP